MEWCLWNASDDAQNYQRNLNIAESEVEDGVIYHKTEYRERRDHYAFYGVNVPTAGWDTDRNTFLGHMGEWRDPQLVREERSTQSKIVGWYPIGCQHLTIALAPGESTRATFVLGYGNPGHAKNSWLTGTASWTFLSISQAILGIYPDYDGLLVKPCIPDELTEYTVLRRFRGTEYTIHVKRTGESSMTVDGVKVSGNLIPLSEKSHVTVEVTL